MTLPNFSSFKHAMLSILLLIISFQFQSCTSAAPGPNQEAVIVDYPWIFGHGGVRAEVVSTGRSFFFMSTDAVNFNIAPVQYDEVFDDLITLDNNPVDVRAYLRLQIKKGKSPGLWEDFGMYWYKNVVQERYRTLNRDFARAYKMFDLTTKVQVSKKMAEEVRNKLQSYFKSIGLDQYVTIEDNIIGGITPPESVIEETKATAAQEQRLKTQTARKAAEEARAIADNAYRKKMGYTASQFLIARQIEVDKEIVEMAKDKENVRVLLSPGQAVQPITNF